MCLNVLSVVVALLDVAVTVLSAKIIIKLLSEGSISRCRVLLK